jgi:hypothetical protein
MHTLLTPRLMAGGLYVERMFDTMSHAEFRDDPSCRS